MLLYASEISLIYSLQQTSLAMITFAYGEIVQLPTDNLALSPFEDTPEKFISLLVHPHYRNSGQWPQKNCQISEQAGSLGAATHFFQSIYTKLISQHMFIDVISLAPHTENRFPFEQLVWLHLVVIYLRVPCQLVCRENMFDA